MHASFNIGPHICTATLGGGWPEVFPLRKQFQYLDVVDYVDGMMRTRVLKTPLGGLVVLTPTALSV